MPVVYCLKDPRDGAIRYVGKTSDYNRRLTQHRANRWDGNLQKHRWIHELRELGLEPDGEIMRVCGWGEEDALERECVRQCIEDGCVLFNEGTFPRKELVSKSEWLAALAEVRVIRNNLMAISTKLCNRTTKNNPAVKLLDKALRLIDRGRFRIEDELYQRYPKWKEEEPKGFELMEDCVARLQLLMEVAATPGTMGAKEAKHVLSCLQNLAVSIAGWKENP